MQTQRFILAAALMVAALASPLTASAQNDARFHLELDYSYHLGLSEKMHGVDGKMTGSRGGHALTINALYNIRPDMTVGVGYGLSRFTRENYGDNNTMPLYATFRYRPFANHRGLYAYTDQGYTLLNDKEGHNFTGGYLGTIGVGYQLMFKRHFGMNFRLGYNIQQFARTKVTFYTPLEQRGENGQLIMNERTEHRSLWRHSLQLGVGLVF